MGFVGGINPKVDTLIKQGASVADLATHAGLALIWIAALLTAITGWDYFRKALPYLRGPK